MKKLLIISAILFANASFAHGYNHNQGYWRHNPGYGWSWVFPAVVGGIIVYEATKPPVVVQQPPVVVQHPQNCGPWTEIKNPDGTVTVSRTCQ